LKPQSPVITISTTPAPVVDGPPDWEVNFSLMAFAKFDPKITTEYFEVRESAKGGLGAFAIKDIEEGTVLLEELPLFKGDFGNIYDEYQKFTEKQTAEYLSLHAWKGSSRGDTETITCIFATNRYVFVCLFNHCTYSNCYFVSFRLTEFDDGIFLKCSRFNHSCHPYASCTYNYNEETDKLKISALRDISIGEEITISYSRDPSSLYENYGFHCDCFGCQQLPLPPPEATTNDLELNTGGSRVYIEW
jgi:hypothetical protein